MCSIPEGFSQETSPIPGSWPFRTWDISGYNRNSPTYGLLLHRSRDRHSNPPVLPQNYLPGPGHRCLGHVRRLYPCLYLFLVPGLSGLFHLLLAFYLPSFQYLALNAQKRFCFFLLETQILFLPKELMFKFMIIREHSLGPYCSQPRSIQRHFCIPCGFYGFASGSRDISTPHWDACRIHPQSHPLCTVAASTWQ